MTLLRGLGVEELSKAELTEWECKLAQMEHGKLGREAFMRQIAEMTEHIVKGQEVTATPCQATTRRLRRRARTAAAS